MTQFILGILKAGLIGAIIGAFAGGLLFQGGVEFGALFGFACAIVFSMRAQTAIIRHKVHSPESVAMSHHVHSSHGWHGDSFGGHDSGGFDGGGFDGGGDAGGGG